MIQIKLESGVVICLYSKGVAIGNLCDKIEVFVITTEHVLAIRIVQIRGKLLIHVIEMMKVNVHITNNNIIFTLVNSQI